MGFPYKFLFIKILSLFKEKQMDLWFFFNFTGGVADLQFCSLKYRTEKSYGILLI